ncbi:protein of unknown function [Pseudomonas inefficax]|uniref:Uncharacterized protein n=1 Tax=Pseudomonas inefficax TaxID=2078786 RepID=A0AAQ1PA71_9PSED|nr:protein of unknown function [Pseudomonas inefficax]
MAFLDLIRALGVFHPHWMQPSPALGFLRLGWLCRYSWWVSGQDCGPRCFGGMKAHCLPQGAESWRCGSGKALRSRRVCVSTVSVR